MRFVLLPVLFVWVLIASAPALLLAQTGAPAGSQEDAALPEITVKDVREDIEQRGRLKPAIERTQVIGEKKMKDSQAKTLAQALENEPGVALNTACSICGIRQVQINGMRGEYTTVLMDDMPMNSTVMSYYGFDALTTAGVARIEVARGSGASLIAPEAIGGVINVVTKKATRNGSYFDLSFGEMGQQNLNALGTSVSKDGKSRLTVSGQVSQEDQVDADRNGVNEAPRRKTASASARLSQDLSGTSNVDLRAGFVQARSFGGVMTESEFGGVSRVGTARFQGGDVRQRYVGDAGALIEAINTDRLDGSARWTKKLDEDSSLVVTASYAQSKQDSFYEDNDYRNEDRTTYADVRYSRALGAAHLLTVGLDGKTETLRSSSYRFYEVLRLGSDAFDYASPGAYVQDVWTPIDELEVSFALRANKVDVDYAAFAGKEISETVVAPRLFAKYQHAPSLASRLGLGQGFRAPLTFFESDHGILSNGFEVRTSALETSDSALYSLAYDDKRLTTTGTVAWTNVHRPSYIDRSGTVPALRSAPEDVSALAWDVLAGYRITNAFGVSLGYERYDYSDRYKALLPVAAIESRVTAGAEYEAGDFRGVLDVAYVGPRDLSPYGYGDRFNVWSGTAASERKSTNAPGFAVVNLRASHKLSSIFDAYVGVKNLLDYKQADVESPLFYDSTGSLDVVHIWGPMRGRQIYAGLSGTF